MSEKTAFDPITNELVALARDTYRMFVEGDPAFLEAWDPEIEFHVPDTLPNGGALYGHMEVLAFFETVSGLWEDARPSPRSSWRRATSWWCWARGGHAPGPQGWMWSCRSPTCSNSGQARSSTSATTSMRRKPSSPLKGQLPGAGIVGVGDVGGERGGCAALTRHLEPTRIVTERAPAPHEAPLTASQRKELPCADSSWLQSHP